MKRIIGLILCIINALFAVAQQKAFDIVAYTAPKDWTLQQNASNISYSRVDGGSWGQIGIYKHRNSDGDIKIDFDKDWNELVSNGKSISSVEKTEPKLTDGWSIMSGRGVWQYNGAKVATILTVYSNQKVCVAIVCNATAMPYLKEYQSLLASLTISTANISTIPSAENNASAIVGLWTDYSLESAGRSFNGTPQYTAGYLRKEYTFNKDGTYIYRNKQWITKTKDILFSYETGTYVVKGNALTITPKNGKGGFWEKKASSLEWGKYVKAFDYQLEKVTYTFKMIEDPNYSNTIVLRASKPTQRDGGKFNAPDDPYVFHYSFRKLASLIDNPPSLK